MNTRRKRRRDLERWGEQQRLEPDDGIQSCLDCGTPLWSDAECYVSESGDGYFCRSCCRQHDEAHDDYDDDSYFDDQFYDEDDDTARISTGTAMKTIVIPTT